MKPNYSNEIFNRPLTAEKLIAGLQKEFALKLENSHQRAIGVMQNVISRS